MPQRATTLASDRRISLELDDGALEWLPLHPFGSFIGNGINLFFDETSVASVRAQLETQPTGKPLDFHHATLKVEEGVMDKAPRAAQIVDVQVRDGYVYGRAVDWVKSALESVKAGEFGFVSSVLHLDDANRVIGYHSHALTNNPGTYGQRRIGLEAGLEAGMRDWLLKLLGLEANASEEQVKLALEGVLSKAKLGEFVIAKLALEGTADSTENRARVLKLVALEGTAEEISKLRVALESQSSKTAESEREGVIKLALEDGRIFEPETAMWRKHLETDFAAGKLALEAMPKRVPLTTPKTPTQVKVSLEGDGAKISQLLGVSLAMLEKGDQ